MISFIAHDRLITIPVAYFPLDLCVEVAHSPSHQISIRIHEFTHRHISGGTSRLRRVV